MKQFEAQVKDWPKKDIRVEKKVYTCAVTAGSKVGDDSETLDEGRSDGSGHHHIWVEKMENFRSCLISIHRVLSQLEIPTPPRVKVRVTPLHSTFLQNFAVPRTYPPLIGIINR